MSLVFRWLTLGKLHSEGLIMNLLRDLGGGSVIPELRTMTDTLNLQLADNRSA